MGMREFHFHWWEAVNSEGAPICIGGDLGVELYPDPAGEISGVVVHQDGVVLYRTGTVPEDA